MVFDQTIQYQEREFIKEFNLMAMIRFSRRKIRKTFPFTWFLNVVMAGNK